jgi:outer membrane immunogenic protein
MKKLVVATTAALVLAAGSAGAADMGVPVLKAAPMKPACAASWFQGGYVGVSGGGVNYTANSTDRDEFLVDASTYTQKKWGGVAGAQIGYNWTTCNTLWGVEVDGSWAYAKATHTYDNFTNNIDQLQNRLDGIVTARTRAGVVLDNLLIYVTGGFAAVHTRTTWSTNFGGGGNPFVELEEKQWRWGFVAGFGTEWAWTDRVSLKSEVLYIETVDRDYSRFVPAFGGFNVNFSQSDSMWVSRIGLNVKLGAPAVVAKY